MKKPEEFDDDFTITFKTQHGKNTMALILMEFLGAYYYPPHTYDCYSIPLHKIYRAVKNAKVKGKDENT
jgi:hypothetical protein